MERRALVGMVVLAAVGVGMVGAGCQTEKRKNNPYMSETGKEITQGDLPGEVQDFIAASYPGAEVEKVYEMRHAKEYHLRHFEIHLIMEGGRKKVFEYHVWQKPTFNPNELKTDEVPGAGTSAAAQPRGEMEGKSK